MTAFHSGGVSPPSPYLCQLHHYATLKKKELVALTPAYGVLWLFLLQTHKNKISC